MQLWRDHRSFLWCLNVLATAALLSCSNAVICAGGDGGTDTGGDGETDTGGDGGTDTGGSIVLPTLSFLGSEHLSGSTGHGDQHIEMQLWLTHPAPVPFTVAINRSGSATLMDTPPFYGAANPGQPVCGPAYTLSTTQVAFAQGDQIQTVTLTIRDRATPDGGHIPDVARRLTLTLDSVAPPGAALLDKNTKDIDITDGTVKGVFDVANPSYAGGAKGNGTDNDQPAIEAAIAAANAAITNQAADQAIVYFPPGTYRVYGHIAPRPKAGVCLIGDTPATSIIKRFGEEALIEAGYLTYTRPDMPTGDWADSQGRIWAWVFVSAYVGTGDSALTVLKNITLDGNLPDADHTTSRWPDFGYPLWEGSMMWHNYGSPNGSSRVLAENCVFRDSPSTNIAGYDYSKNQYYNCNMHNNIESKGCISANGPYVYITIDQCTFDGDRPSGLDIEQEDGSEGGIYAVIKNTTMNGAWQFDAGDAAAHGHPRASLRFENFQQKYAPTGQSFYSSSCYGCEITAVGSTFYKERSAGGYGMLQRLGSLDFMDCTFYATNNGRSDGLASALHINSLSVTGIPTLGLPLTATFTRCTFDKHESLGEDAYYAVATHLQTSVGERQSITFNDCVFHHGSVANLRTGGTSNVGGSHTFNNATFHNVAHPFYMTCKGENGADVHSLRMRVNGVNWNGAASMLYLYGADTPAIGNHVYLDYNGTVVPKASAVIVAERSLAAIPDVNYGAYPNGRIAADQTGTPNTDIATAEQDSLVNMQYHTTNGGDRRSAATGWSGQSVWVAP